VSGCALPRSEAASTGPKKLSVDDWRSTMPDLKALLERESDRAQCSGAALDATLSRVRRRQRHRRVAAGAAGLAAFVPAAVLAVWLGLSARHPAPVRSPLATAPTSAPLVGRGTIAGRLTAS